MNKIWGVLVVLIFITGCASSKTIIGPDGTENQLIKCNRIELCYEKSTEICKGPYKIINSNSDSNKNGTEFNLLIKCGN
jgi:hypothetical protein